MGDHGWITYTTSRSSSRRCSGSPAAPVGTIAAAAQVREPVPGARVRRTRRSHGGRGGRAADELSDLAVGADQLAAYDAVASPFILSIVRGLWNKGLSKSFPLESFHSLYVLEEIKHSLKPKEILL